MATTPGGLPYPLPTDPIAQGADAIKNLALALDGAWQPITWNANWANVSGFIAGAYRLERPDTVAIRGSVQRLSAGTGTDEIVYTLPAGFRPQGTVDIALATNRGVAGSGATLVRAHIATTGTITLNVFGWTMPSNTVIAFDAVRFSIS